MNLICEVLVRTMGDGIRVVHEAWYQRGVKTPWLDGTGKETLPFQPKLFISSWGSGSSMIKSDVKGAIP